MLAGAGQLDIGTAEGDAISLLALYGQIKNVAISHEASDMQVRRLCVDIVRCRDLLHDPVFHYDDAIGER